MSDFERWLLDTQTTLTLNEWADEEWRRMEHEAEQRRIARLIAEGSIIFSPPEPVPTQDIVILDGPVTFTDCHFESGYTTEIDGRKLTYLSTWHVVAESREEDDARLARVLAEWDAEKIAAPFSPE